MKRNETKVAQFDKTLASPFVKWAGGKRSLIPDIATKFPMKVKNYYEPFVGGGAVFFSFVDQIEHAYLSDSNKELIKTYIVVKNNVWELIDLLREHQIRNKKNSYFNTIRDSAPTNDIEIAARFIYLNKTCFNGLYRVNRSGAFNVPKGSYKNPDICNPERLLAASKALSKAKIQFGDFQKLVNPSRGDFIYCDPPYDNCFTQYQPDGFLESDQVRLRDSILNWKKMGAKILISNSDTKLINSLYGNKKQFKISVVKAPRIINSNGKGRKPVNELLVRTYD